MCTFLNLDWDQCEVMISDRLRQTYLQLLIIHPDYLVFIWSLSWLSLVMLVCWLAAYLQQVPLLDHGVGHLGVRVVDGLGLHGAARPHLLPPRLLRQPQPLSSAGSTSTLIFRLIIRLIDLQNQKYFLGKPS